MDYSFYAEEPPEDRTIDLYDPNIEGYYSLERLNGKVKINTETDCWECTTSLTSQGYGQMRIDGKYWTTHRYALYCVTDIPEGMQVRHMCHNTKCCNPDHLTWGTARDNWRDSEEIHRESHRKMSKKVTIGDRQYESYNKAAKDLRMDTTTISKYTDSNGIFDISAYRKSCAIVHVTPRV